VQCSPVPLVQAVGLGCTGSRSEEGAAQAVRVRQRSVSSSRRRMELAAYGLRAGGSTRGPLAAGVAHVGYEGISSPAGGVGGVSFTSG
jgi:hypothetical protein